MTGTATLKSRKSVAPHGPRGKAEVSRLLGLPLCVRVVLAERKMPLDAVLAIRAGTIIEFDVPFDADLLLYAGDRLIGVGQAVKVGENFGLRISSIGTARQRTDALGM